MAKSKLLIDSTTKNFQIEKQKKSLDDLKKTAHKFINNILEPPMENKKVYLDIGEALFRQISEEVKKLLAKLCYEAEGEIDVKPPCDYALIGLGAMALNQITPYSDFKLAILIEEDVTNKEYFKKLYEKLYLIINEVTSKTNSNIEARIGTQEEFLKLISSENTSNQAKNNWYSDLDKICYISGNRLLVASYQKAVPKQEQSQPKLQTLVDDLKMLINSMQEENKLGGDIGDAVQLAGEMDANDLDTSCIHLPT